MVWYRSQNLCCQKLGMMVNQEEYSMTKRMPKLSRNTCWCKSYQGTRAMKRTRAIPEAMKRTRAVPEAKEESWM